jgi:DNA-binding NarL/FixJ family response regulator
MNAASSPAPANLSDRSAIVPCPARDGTRRSIRVLIFSDIRIYREGLAKALHNDRAIVVVGAYAAVRDALEQAADLGPDVVLLDVANPDALREVKRVHAGFAGAPIVALGVLKHDGDVIACAEAGIAGYVFRDASLEDLVASVESAARGELRCSPMVAATILRRVATLAARQRVAPPPPHRVTRREREILELIELGLSNKQIAARLVIEIATVKNHIHNILEKLRVRTRSEAAATLRRARDRIAVVEGVSGAER